MLCGLSCWMRWSRQRRRRWWQGGDHRWNQMNLWMSYSKPIISSWRLHFLLHLKPVTIRLPITCHHLQLDTSYLILTLTPPVYISSLSLPYRDWYLSNVLTSSSLLQDNLPSVCEEGAARCSRISPLSAWNTTARATLLLSHSRRPSL